MKENWCPSRVTLVTDDPAELKYPCRLKVDHEGLHQLPVQINNVTLMMEWDDEGGFWVRPMSETMGA